MQLTLPAWLFLGLAGTHRAMPGWLFPEHVSAFPVIFPCISDRKPSVQTPRSICLSRHQLHLLQPQTWPGTASSDWSSTSSSPGYLTNLPSILQRAWHLGRNVPALHLLFICCRCLFPCHQLIARILGWPATSDQLEYLFSSWLFTS